MSHPAHWLLAAALLIPLAGCGGSSDPATPAAAGVDGGGGEAGDDGGGEKAGECDALYGVTVCMAYDLTGAVTAKGHLAGNVTNGVEQSPETCAEWAKGAEKDGERRLFMPLGGPLTPGEEFNGLTGNIITNYTGPGTYQKKDLSGQGSPSGVLVNAGGSYVLYSTDSTGTATVAADGSGSFTFTGLGSGSGSPTVSGSVTWTCHNP